MSAAHLDEADSRALSELTADPAVRAFRPISDPVDGNRLWLVELNLGYVLEDVGRTDVVADADHYRGSHATARLFALRNIARQLPAMAVAKAPDLAAPEWLDIDAAARHRGVSRDTVERVLSRAPTDIAGAPEDNGTRARHAWRWRAETVDEWWVVATAAARGAPPASPPRRQKRRHRCPSGAAGPITVADLDAAAARKAQR